MNPNRSALAALCVAANCITAAAKCYEFSMRNKPASENVFAATNDAKVIAEVEKDLKAPEAQRRMIIGRIATGNDGINAPWTWHFIANEWSLAEIAIELCDGSPSYVEAHRDEWIRDVKSFCPWSSMVSRECASSGINPAEQPAGGIGRLEGRIHLRGPAGAKGARTLALTLPSAGHATLKAYRPDGSLAADLDLGELPSGSREIAWQDRNSGTGMLRLVLGLDGQPVAAVTAVLP